MAWIKYHDYSKEKIDDESFQKLLKESTIIKDIKIEDFVMSKKNANIMEEKTFKRLTENVERDGMLTSVPFVHKLKNGKYEVISGNHRIKSAKAQGLKTVTCMACEVTLPNDDKLRIQISHNSIHGEHNATILTELTKEFENINMARLSGADFEISLMDDNKVDFLSIDANALEQKEVVLYFTSPEKTMLDKLIADLDSKLTSEKSSVYIVNKKELEKFIDLIVNVKSEANIKSTSVIVSLMIDYVYNNLESFISKYAPKE